MLVISTIVSTLASTNSSGIALNKTSDNKNVEDNCLLEITFTKHIIDDSFNRVSGLYCCDIDGDDDNDIIGTALGESGITWWRNDGGNPIIWTKQIIDANYRSAIYVYATDIDGDDDIDVIATAASMMGKIAWWENNGGNPPNWTRCTITNQFGMAHGIFALDLDQDGDTDVLGTSASMNRISWWENDASAGNGSSWTEHVVDEEFAITQSVYSTDLDHDGLADVIGASYGDNEVAWWHNNGGSSLTFTKQTISTTFNGAHWVYADDVDGDGFKDILAAGASNSQIAWWKNPGIYPSNNWKKQTISKGFYGALTVHAADLDNDGDVDVMGTANGDDEVTWWENDGETPINWIPHILDEAFDGAWPIYSCDVDSDGDNDIIAGADTDNTVACWENHLFNRPEKPSRPVGSGSGKPGEVYSFSTVTTDMDGDDLFYLFDWGDESNCSWIGSFNSGEICEASHSWEMKGDYQIKVKARDINGCESEWSDPLPVSMPKNKILDNIIFKNIIEYLRLQFPFLSLIFNDLGAKR